MVDKCEKTYTRESEGRRGPGERERERDQRREGEKKRDEWEGWREKVP